MKFAQPIRIALLLVAIFVAGIITGRLTAPGSPTQVITAGGRTLTAETVLARLSAEVGLDAFQRAQFRPLLEELAGRMARVPPATPERRDLFRSYVPRMRALLRAEQLAAFERYFKQTERRVDQVIRRHNPEQPRIQ